MIRAYAVMGVVLVAGCVSPVDVPVEDPCNDTPEVLEPFRTDREPQPKLPDFRPIDPKDESEDGLLR